VNAFEIAQETFVKHIQQNSYPGRGLVVGRPSDDGASGHDASSEAPWLIVYWIMGRSAHSQNRRFVAKGSVLRTVPVDPSLVRDPSLIIYEGMLELPGIYLVSNGDQTRTIYEALRVSGTFDGALATREREPDPPNYTPRISAMLDLRLEAQLSLSLLKANPVDPAYTDRYTYRPAPPPQGLGFGLTTYVGDGSPLPAFTGDPLLLPLEGSAQAVLDAYWDALDADNRVALAVKRIPCSGDPSEILVCNRF
jgi:IMP cyclohydrolase